MIVSFRTLKDSMFRLCDFLGIELQVIDGKIGGKSTITTDWGLTQVEAIQKIFSHVVDTQTGECAVLIALPKDLGIVALFDPGSEYIDLFIIDRSSLPERGVRLFEKKGVKTPTDVVDVIDTVVVRQFAGKIGGKFEEVFE